MKLMKTSTLSTIAICGFLTLSLIHARAIPDPSNAEKIERIFQREREIDAVSDQRQAKLDRRVRPIISALIRGDYAGVDTAATQKDAEALWYIFTEAAARSIGYGDMSRLYPNRKEASAKCDELNKRIAEYVRPKLAAIPGHAKAIGDRLEMMSQEVGYWNYREGALRKLGLLGSMEAIQQIGRFLDDRRNPDEAISLHMIESSRAPPSSNLNGAAYAMVKALGDASPVQLPRSLTLTSSAIDTLQSWWKSDASKPYREWTYETGHPMPPPRPWPVAGVLPPKAPEAVVAVQKTPTVIPSQHTALKPWVLWTLAAAGISLAVLMAMRSRRH